MQMCRITKGDHTRPSVDKVVEFFFFLLSGQMAVTLGSQSVSQSVQSLARAEEGDTGDSGSC